MGGQESKPIQEDDFFILEHISKVSLRSGKTVSYYWIDPSKSGQAEVLGKLRQYFKLDWFPEVKTLKQQMSFFQSNQVVKVIFDQYLSQEDQHYLQNQSKIAQIIYFGPPSGNPQPSAKLLGNAYNTQDLIKILNDLQAKEHLQIPANNLLVMGEQDIKLINKYRLNYHCITQYAGREKAKQDLVSLAKKLYPQQEDNIQNFQKNYKIDLNGVERRNMVFDWIFKDNFFWDLINSLPKNTTDPKRLAYVRLALKDIHQAIFNHYKEKKKVYKIVYLVLDLTEQEKQKLERGVGNFLLFTSFVRGYLSETEANVEYRRNPSSFKFIIMTNRSPMEQNLDFGFYIRQGITGLNVLYNIYNLFRIDTVSLKGRFVELLYGSLAEIFYKRKVDFEQAQKKIQKDPTKVPARHIFSPEETTLLRNYDYLEDMLQRVDSQATILQLSGYFYQSLEVYDRKVNFIRKTNQSEQTMSRCLIKKGDALRLNGEFQKAEKQYQSVCTKSQTMHLISLIHLAQLCIHQGQDEKLEKILLQIQPKIGKLQKNQKEEYLKGSNLLAMRNIKKGQLKKAQVMLQKLTKQLRNLYKDGLQGKPIVHDIYRSLATCKSKRGQHKQALQLLKETLSWQIGCQGKTPNVALTQTLIQSVSQSSGDTQQWKKSSNRLSTMSNSIEASQIRCQSAIMIGLSQSLKNPKHSTIGINLQ